MAHTDWLLRGPEKSVLPYRALCEGNTLFCRPVSFGGNISKQVRWKSLNNNMSWNISVAFLESCLSISDQASNGLKAFWAPGGV